MRKCGRPSSPTVIACDGVCIPMQEPPIEAHPKPRHTRKAADTYAHIAPLWLSTMLHTDVDMGYAPAGAPTKRMQAQSHELTFGCVAPRAKNVRSINVHKGTVDASAAVGIEQLGMFAGIAGAIERTPAQEPAKRPGKSAKRYRPTKAQRDELRMLRGYLATRLDERGMPLEDTALVTIYENATGSDGVDAGRLLAMAQTLAQLEREAKRWT